MHHPINWAEDLSMLLFAWAVFLSADVALRTRGFVGIDMIVSKFPARYRSFLFYLWSALVLVFLGILACYSIPLCINNYKRLFQALGISYSWATASVPVGALAMFITSILKLLIIIKKTTSRRGQDNVYCNRCVPIVFIARHASSVCNRNFWNVLLLITPELPHLLPFKELLLLRKTTPFLQFPYLYLLET